LSSLRAAFNMIDCRCVNKAAKLVIFPSKNLSILLLFA
jgi:hypothetical protein